jgi:short-subunit dehydrogenase
MKPTLNPLFLAGLGATAAAAAAAVALTRNLRSVPPPDNAVVVITGGSRGLGYALANRFASRHIRLVIAARDLAELQSAQDKLLSLHDHLRPEDFYLVAADLAHPDECRRLIHEALNHFGRVDVLINNAGVVHVGPIESQTTEIFEETMRINFFAALYTTWAALPHMRQQEPLAGWPHRAAILNIASIGGKVAVPHMLPYSAAKFALLGFSEGLYAELRSQNILVTTVCPGLMRTGGEDHARFLGDAQAEARWFKFCATTPGLSTTPEHAADRIYDAVAHSCAEITITPQAWLAARFVGHWPGATQFLSSLANDYILPAAP